MKHIIQLDRMFKNRRTPVKLETICELLECSQSTFYRVQRDMIDVLGAPIINIKNQGYQYDLNEVENFELPGLWFTPEELIALSLLEQLSESLQPEFIKQILRPLQKRLKALLEQQQIDPENWQNRLTVISQWQTTCEPDQFTKVAYALMHRKQINIDYWKWQIKQAEKRLISPQRLIYYRDNWYLIAWCHLRQALRTFLVSSVQNSQITKEPAHEVAVEQLDQHVKPGYGIFSGQVRAKATLKFSLQISARVSRETWHPEQTCYWTEEQHYVLTVPYSDNRELIRDILRYGADVEVLAPDSLRSQIQEEIEKALQRYISPK